MDPSPFVAMVFGIVIVGLLAYVIVGQKAIHVLVNSQYSEIKERLEASERKVEALEKLLSVKEAEKEN